MKSFQLPALVAFAAMLSLSCYAERVKFADDRFSIEFPDGWKKTAPGGDPAPLVLRQNDDGTALFAVSRLAVPEGAKVDLDATARTIANSHKDDLKLDKVPEAGAGEIDGLPARFLTIAPPKPAAPEEGADPGEEALQVAYFIVLVDTRKGVMILQATLALPAAKETREAALAIIQSFKREG
jgi:hypothetical protein